MIHAAWMLLLLALGVSNAIADGLVSQLPPDGTFSLCYAE